MVYPYVIGDRKRHHHQHFFCRLRMYSLPTFYLPHSLIHLNPQPTNQITGTSLLHYTLIACTKYARAHSKTLSLLNTNYICSIRLVLLRLFSLSLAQRCTLHGISLFIICTTEIFRHFLLLGPRRGMIELCSFGRATRKSSARSATPAL